MTPAVTTVEQGDPAPEEAPRLRVPQQARAQDPSTRSATTTGTTRRADAGAAAPDHLHESETVAE